jgi:mannose-6-phosphate isomerase-like protein (cupin superfamily)
MKVTRKNEVMPIDSGCGELRELYKSDKLDIAHVIVNTPSKKHMHKKTLEVYYITKGAGIVVIGDEELEVKEGDTIPIPKNTWHYLKTKGKPFELLTITHPKWTQEDEISEEK